LKAAAEKHAPGMKPEGPQARQELKQHEHVSMAVYMQAGHCYTIVGFAPQGSIQLGLHPATRVQDLDLTLLSIFPGVPGSFGQDGMNGPLAVIGSGQRALCPLFPGQYKLDIYAAKGEGPVVVQVYSRNR
jgi:hypothetical protein